MLVSEVHWILQPRKSIFFFQGTRSHEMDGPRREKTVTPSSYERSTLAVLPALQRAGGYWGVEKKY